MQRSPRECAAPGRQKVAARMRYGAAFTGEGGVALRCVLGAAYEWRRQQGCRSAVLERPLLGDDCRGTIVAMSTEALRTVKDRFSEYVDRVENEHERVVVPR